MSYTEEDTIESFLISNICEAIDKYNVEVDQLCDDDDLVLIEDGITDNSIEKIKAICSRVDRKRAPLKMIVLWITVYLWNQEDVDMQNKVNEIASSFKSIIIEDENWYEYNQQENLGIKPLFWSDYLGNNSDRKYVIADFRKGIDEVANIFHAQDNINVEICIWIIWLLDDISNDRKVFFSDKMDKVTNLLNITAIKADVTTEEYIKNNVSIVDNDISDSTSSISPDTCIGTDSDGKVYIAKNLIDQTILLTYNEDDKEIYFLGQYNKNYHWNGYCVINTYDADGKLNGINESNFDDGNRLDYESYYLSDKQNEWIYTDRDCKEETNEGISIRYKSNFSKQKNFTATNVRVSDLIYIESMKEYDNKEILSYYMGKTSNGVYNDDSGNAYLVMYNSEGFVSVYYKGNFKDGYFEDENAIEIVLDESYNINKYFLYNGGFTRGERISDDGIKYITQDEINTILKENGCKDNFTWYSENS